MTDFSTMNDTALNAYIAELKKEQNERLTAINTARKEFDAIDSKLADAIREIGKRNGEKFAETFELTKAHVKLLKHCDGNLERLNDMADSELEEAAGLSFADGDDRERTIAQLLSEMPFARRHVMNKLDESWVQSNE